MLKWRRCWSLEALILCFAFIYLLYVDIKASKCLKNVNKSCWRFSPLAWMHSWNLWCQELFVAYADEFQACVGIVAAAGINAKAHLTCSLFSCKLCRSDGPRHRSRQVWNRTIVEATKPVTFVPSVYLDTESSKASYAAGKMSRSSSCINHIVCRVANGTSSRCWSNYSVKICKKDASESRGGSS
jgi:hypothetical protein